MNVLCWLGLHHWRMVRDTHKHQYYECHRCQKRTVIESFPWGYQPIDSGWLLGGDWFAPERDLVWPIGAYVNTQDKPDSLDYDQRNAAVLASFAEFCKQHPQMRFWQALTVWSGYGVFLAYPEQGVMAPEKFIDTWDFEGRNS